MLKIHRAGRQKNMHRLRCVDFTTSYSNRISADIEGVMRGVVTLLHDPAGYRNNKHPCAECYLGTFVLLLKTPASKPLVMGTCLCEQANRDPGCCYTRPAAILPRVVNALETESNQVTPTTGGILLGRRE